MAVKLGGTLVLERSFAYPALVLQRIEEERVTGFPGVPTVFATLLQMDRSAFDLTSLRYVTSAADALSPAHISRLQEAFPGVALYSMYGLTETARALYLPPSQLTTRPGSVGIPIPGTEAWVEDECGRRLGAGETGELVVRGRHVMRGYWESPSATAERFREGSEPGERICHTGDLFRTDEEGYFYFVSRMDDIIKCRGEKVAPKEVEAVLHMLPGVVAAVVGVPDPVAGRAVKAYIVSMGGPLTESEVIAHCRAHLEEYKVPRYIEFRSELPVTPSGKVHTLGLDRSRSTNADAKG
jgi:acyl-coenzyme A synthetase/AMP-(fatty) acid ligase